MHLDNRTVDGELGSRASLTPAGNQLSPWSVRFNYPYLSLNNCKCYCWSHKLSRPLKTPSHFPDSVLSTDRETITVLSKESTTIWTPVLCRLCVWHFEGPNMLSSKFLFVSYWQRKAVGLVTATRGREEKRADMHNLPLGGWEMLGERKKKRGREELENHWSNPLYG